MVKALFPIGKTQWAKWNDEQRTAFNEVRAAGLPFDEAVKYVASNGFVAVDPEPVKKAEEKPKKSGLMNAIEDTLDGLKKVESAVETVASVAASVSPVVAVAKTVAKATSGKKGK